ncbi:hypothetical protein D3C71_829330 [compost metagenome]
MKNTIHLIKLLALQTLGIFFFSIAGTRFYACYRANLIDCFLKQGAGADCLNQLPGYTIGKLMTEMFYSSLYGIIFGFILIGFLNVRKKKSILNTLLVVGLTVLLFVVGFYKLSRPLDLYLLSFGNLFSTDFGTASMIAGICNLLLGSVCVWLSMKNGFQRKNRLQV